MDKPKNETCKAIELGNRMVDFEPKVSKEKKESSKVEKRCEKEVIVEKEIEKSSKVEKNENNSD